MGILSRIGIALDSDLLARFDRFIARQGYTNRSEAFRDLIRDRLVTAAVEDGRVAARYLEQAGCDEFVLFPTSSASAQVDLLADAIL